MNNEFIVDLVSTFLSVQDIEFLGFTCRDLELYCRHVIASRMKEWTDRINSKPTKTDRTNVDKIVLSNTDKQDKSRFTEQKRERCVRFDSLLYEITLMFITESGEKNLSRYFNLGETRHYNA